MILAQAETDVIQGGDLGSDSATGTQTIQTDPNQPLTQGPAKKPSSNFTFILLGLMFVVFYFMIFRGPKKKQQQQQKMIQSLQKNARVQTIGGLLATVIEVGDNEITLKIDESNNTKI
ncbi:MAG: preprotein translocase subunit YajC, partial [Planctomycetes bacterium]|nr:preprotein translocase subunit YajC [Planctomycetota bacterium]